MRRFLKIYLEKPELAGGTLLLVLIILFQFRSNGVVLS
jgi:simple sugar transport system permease protein